MALRARNVSGAFEKQAPKGRTIRKVMGGGGGTKKKFMQGKLSRKKIRAKKKVKKKNSCRRKVQVRLLWLDVIYLLGCCHRKNFAVLLWFAIIAFNKRNCVL